MDLNSINVNTRLSTKSSTKSRSRQRKERRKITKALREKNIKALCDRHEHYEKKMKQKYRCCCCDPDFDWSQKHSESACDDCRASGRVHLGKSCAVGHNNYYSGEYSWCEFHDANFPECDSGGEYENNCQFCEEAYNIRDEVETFYQHQIEMFSSRCSTPIYMSYLMDLLGDVVPDLITAYVGLGEQSPWSY